MLLGKWEELITNYFLERRSSGFVVGLGERAVLGGAHRMAVAHGNDSSAAPPAPGKLRQRQPSRPTDSPYR
jgi:hypothetical protein